MGNVVKLMADCMLFGHGEAEALRSLKHRQHSKASLFVGEYLPAVCAKWERQWKEACPDLRLVQGKSYEVCFTGKTRVAIATALQYLKMCLAESSLQS